MKSQKWTTNNIPDLRGKVILVTGGNSGLGFESVKACVEKDAEVILACRNIQKGETAKSEIVKTYPKANIQVMELDLMDLSSIKDFASSFNAKYNRLDVLLNNAGIMMTPYSMTKDGFESQLGTNHLGHFALTGQLFDIIQKTPESRIVNISSLAHKGGTFDFEDLLYSNGSSYDPMKAYRRSKMANLLFTYELQRKLAATQSDTIAVAAHPGVSMTNLANHLKGSFMFKIFELIGGFISHDPAKGALPGIRASIDPTVHGGEYYGPDGMMEMKGNPVKVASNKASHNQEDARKLWEVSEQMTGVKFDMQ